MPRPPGTPLRGVWGMGARLWIFRIFKRCRSLGAAVFVVCLWFCLITVINLGSNGGQSNVELKEDAHLLARSSGLASYPALFGLSPVERRIDDSPGFNTAANLVLRNELKASIPDLKGTTTRDGQTANLVKNGIISGRRIQGIKFSEMEGLETLSRRYESDQGEEDARQSIDSHVPALGEREQIDTKAITVMEIKPDIQTPDKNLGDLQPNWTPESETHGFRFLALDIPKHEQSQTREEPEPSPIISSRAKNSLSEPDSNDRKTRSETAEERAMMVKYGLQARRKSISSHLPQSIGEMHNRQNNFYDSSSGVGAINTHFNSDELPRTREIVASRDPSNSRMSPSQNSNQYLTALWENLDKVSKTETMKAANRKSNLESSIAMQMNVPKRNAELTAFKSIDQDIQPTTPQMNSSVKYLGHLPTLHHASDKSNKGNGDVLGFLQTGQTTNISHAQTRNGSNLTSSANRLSIDANSREENGSYGTSLIKNQSKELGKVKEQNSYLTDSAENQQNDINTSNGTSKNNTKTWRKPNNLRYDGFEMYSYNVTASDKLSLKRLIPDSRPVGCPQLSLDISARLPTATVIICFHNEALSVLLRTVHSVLDRTPSHLLEKIILVDDYSTMDDLGPELQRELDHLSDIILLTRNTKREGLVRSRLSGASMAKSDVIVFLDAHCECNTGWIEPLLYSLQDHPNKVVSPYIDTIKAENFHYKRSPDNLQGGFNWRLEFGWRAASGITQSSEKTEKIITPVISGGLFAIRKDYFNLLGSYDPQLDIWGGENFELSFKTWMCGGSMEILPCSRVGHVFRASLPYTFTGDREETVLRNLARVASVWMDEYADIFYAAVNLPNDLDIGNISDRIQLRESLKCQSFKWYLDNVFPQMHMVAFDTIMYGQVRNKGSVMCLDVMNSATEYYLGLSACHGGKNQTLRLTSENELKQGDACIVPGVNKKLTLSLCNNNASWIYKNGVLNLDHTDLCLTSVDNEVVRLLQCDSGHYTEVVINSQQHRKKSLTVNDNLGDDSSYYISNNSIGSNSFQQWTFDYSFNWKRRRRRNG